MAESAEVAPPIRSRTAYWSSLPAIAVLLSLCAAASFGADPPQPLRIGLGGEFIAGWEGMIARMGLPHERVWVEDLSKLDVLKQYDIVFVSSPSASDSEFPAAFRSYIESGGRGVLEMLRGPAGNLLPGGLTVGSYPLGMRIVTGTPVLSQAIPPDRTFPCIPSSLWSLAVPDSADVTTLARYTAEGVGDADPSNPLAQNGGLPAISLVRMGKGEMVFCGAAVGFAIGWRVPQDEPIATVIIQYLIRDLGQPCFTPGTGYDDDIDPTNGSGASGDEGTPVPQTTVQTPAPVERPRLFVPVETVAPDAFDLAISVSDDPAVEGTPGPSLLFDYENAKRAYALTLSPSEVAVGRLEPGGEVPLARAMLDGGVTSLVVRERPGAVAVVADERFIGTWPSLGPTPGAVFARRRVAGLRLSEFECQPISPVYFADDFSRDQADLGQWEPLNGAWVNIGLEHPDQSVNGFTLFGESAEPSMAATGYDFWQDYVVGAAAQPLAEDTVVGLAVGCHGSADACVFRIRPGDGGNAEIVRITPQSETVLASAHAYRAASTWMRLNVRSADGTITGYVDGRPLLSCPDPTTRSGRIALYVSGGRAAFDDVEVVPSDTITTAVLPPYRREGSQSPILPLNVGPTDYMTWACQAVQWKAEPQHPSRFWRRGVFAGDVTVSIRLPQPLSGPAQFSLLLSPTKDADRAAAATVSYSADGKGTVALSSPGQAPQSATVALPPDGRASFSLSREAGRLVARLDGRQVLSAAADPAARFVGAELLDGAIPPSDLRVESAHIRDYTFSAAPTDWRFAAGQWEVRARWACDDRWSWLTGVSDDIAAAWNKHRFEGDMGVDYYMGVKHKGPGGDETERTRDVNAVICGDGQDVRTGYTVIMGGADGVVTQLLRDGQVIAEAPNVVIPREYAVHHQWLHFRLERIGNRIRFHYEDRLVFDVEDPEPITGGYVGVWTHRSGVCVARVTVYAEREGQSAFLPPLPAD